MSARSGLAGKRTSQPHLGPGHCLRGPEKSKNCQFVYLFFLVGQWALFTWFGVMCWCHFQLVITMSHPMFVQTPSMLAVIKAKEKHQQIMRGPKPGE